MKIILIVNLGYKLIDYQPKSNLTLEPNLCLKLTFDIKHPLHKSMIKYCSCIIVSDTLDCVFENGDIGEEIGNLQDGILFFS